MGCQIYQKNNFKIYKAGHNYIVHNAKYDFVEKHTHVKNFNAAKKVIALAMNKKVPRDFPDYLIVSIIRVSDDEDYIEHLEELVEVRKQKGKKLKYHNCH
jgi:hypothetical protein